MPAGYIAISEATALAEAAILEMPSAIPPRSLTAVIAMLYGHGMPTNADE